MKSSTIGTIATMGIFAILFACSIATNGISAEPTDMGTVSDSVEITLGDCVDKTITIPVSYHTTLGTYIADVRGNASLDTSLSESPDKDIKGYGQYFNRFISVTFTGTPETVGTFTTTAVVELSYQYRAILSYELTLTVVVTE